MRPLWRAQKLQQICLFSCQHTLQWGGHNPSQHSIQSCVCLQSSWPGSAMQYKCWTNLWLVFWQAHHCKLLEPLNRCGVQSLNGRIWSGAVTWGLSWTNCMRQQDSNTFSDTIKDLNGRLWAAAHYVSWVAIMPAFDSFRFEVEWFWFGLKMIFVIKMQHGAFEEAAKVLETLYVQIFRLFKWLCLFVVLFL